MAWTMLTSLLLAAILHLLFIPLVGASLLSLCFRATGLPALPFSQRWKAYLAAVAYGLILGFGISHSLSGLHLGPSAFLAIQLGGICLLQLLVVALLLRKLSCRALLAQAIAVCATNLVTATALLAGV